MQEDKSVDILQSLLVNLSDVESGEILARFTPYREMLIEYQCAMLEVETKLRVLDTEFSLDRQSNPIESIQSRIKEPRSLLKKLKDMRLEPTLENIRNNIFDIAGIRVICSFEDDVYRLINALKQQSDVDFIAEKDYIRYPKKSGYRSYHLVISIPIFLSAHSAKRAVEVQFRTIAMDSWASLEHKLRYKKDSNNEEINRRLFMCAEISAHLDKEMMAVRDLVRSMDERTDE